MPMTQTLNGLMVDSLAGDSFGNMDSDLSNEETEKIIQEASGSCRAADRRKIPIRTSFNRTFVQNNYFQFRVEDEQTLLFVLIRD